MAWTRTHIVFDLQLVTICTHRNELMAELEIMQYRACFHHPRASCSTGIHNHKCHLWRYQKMLREVQAVHILLPLPPARSFSAALPDDRKTKVGMMPTEQCYFYHKWMRSICWANWMIFYRKYFTMTAWLYAVPLSSTDLCHCKRHLLKRVVACWRSIDSLAMRRRAAFTHQHRRLRASCCSNERCWHRELFMSHHADYRKALALPFIELSR